MGLHAHSLLYVSGFSEIPGICGTEAHQILLGFRHAGALLQPRQAHRAATSQESSRSSTIEPCEVWDPRYPSALAAIQCGFPRPTQECNCFNMPRSPFGGFLRSMQAANRGSDGPGPKMKYKWELHLCDAITFRRIEVMC